MEEGVRGKGHAPKHAHFNKLLLLSSLLNISNLLLKALCSSSAILK